MSHASPTAIGHRTTALGSQQVIRSPEQVAMDLTIAGPMSRMLAFGADYSIVILVEIFVVIALMLVFAISIDLAPILEQLQLIAEGEQQEFDFLEGRVFVLIAIFTLVDFALQSLYFIVSESLMQGRSPGKAMFGLRVVRDGGLPLTLRDSAVRNLMRIVDLLPSSYVVGLASIIASPSCKRLGDHAAGTIVIREDRPEPARRLPARPATGGELAFRFDREQLSRFGANEKRLARQSLRRLETLDAVQREHVLARTSGVIRERIEYPEPVPEREQEDFLRALLRASDEV